MNLTPVTNTMECHHAGGSACANHGAGHTMRAIRAQAAAATGSKWVDGIVRSTTSDGWIGIDLIVSGDTVWVWNHADLTASVQPGQPVALHSLYNVLASGDARISVIALTE